ncbi:DUF3016 domain-containing protein [Thalassotalea montiporae]
MKHTKLVVMAAIVGTTLSFSSLAFSAQPNKVEVNWTNAEKYRDLRSTTETKRNFQQRFFKEISAYLKELSQSLPKGYQLNMDVTQVDLAGRITFVRGQQVRIIKDIDYPNMAFSYQLKNASGQIIAEQQAQVKGKAFLAGSQHQSHRMKPFAYEKQMLEDWFDKEIVSKF